MYKIRKAEKLADKIYLMDVEAPRVARHCEPGQFVIVKFKGIDNINDVEQYKGSSLFVSRENAVSLEENEYYIADLIGMEVFTEEGHFGIVKDVMETGANEVYIIDSDVHGEVLVPAIKQCIENVDVENGKMQIRLLEGLIG